MTRPIITVPILSALAWGLIGLLAWYAPLTLAVFGFAGLLAFLHDVCTES